MDFHLLKWFVLYQQGIPFSFVIWKLFIMENPGSAGFTKDKMRVVLLALNEEKLICLGWTLRLKISTLSSFAKMSWSLEVPLENDEEDDHVHTLRTWMNDTRECFYSPNEKETVDWRSWFKRRACIYKRTLVVKLTKGNLVDVKGNQADFRQWLTNQDVRNFRL